jgi:hypothetical protein
MKDTTPNTNEWTELLRVLPDEMQYQRVYDFSDKRFEIEVWVPRDTQKLAKFILRLPERSLVEKVLCQDEDLCLSILIPKDAIKRLAPLKR